MGASPSFTSDWKNSIPSSAGVFGVGRLVEDVGGFTDAAWLSAIELLGRMAEGLGRWDIFEFFLGCFCDFGMVVMRKRSEVRMASFSFGS
jgi:hypothetical protein